MSFSWEDYFYLAKDLLRGTQESYFRSSISRAYYAVFCIGRNKQGDQILRDGIHWEVINAYKNSNNTNEQAIGWGLDKLRKLRNDADYDETKTIEKALAERAIKNAESILRRMGIL